MCRRSWVSGKVQGVGYRNFACRAARESGIAGYARNLPDGRVEVLSCGEDSALNRFADRLREGPRWSRVAEFRSETAGCIESGEFLSE